MSTVDWIADEMSRKFKTENYSSEEMTTLVGPGAAAAYGSFAPYKSALISVSALGLLTNGMVLGGFFLAGRSKMNHSSAHIANHTTLERITPYPSTTHFDSLHTWDGMQLAR